MTHMFGCENWVSSCGFRLSGLLYMSGFQVIAKLRTA